MEGWEGERRFVCSRLFRLAPALRLALVLDLALGMAVLVLGRRQSLKAQDGEHRRLHGVLAVKRDVADALHLGHELVADRVHLLQDVTAAARALTCHVALDRQSIVRGMLIASAGREGGAFKSGPQSGMQRAMKSTMGQARCSEGSGVLQKLDASAARAQRRVRAARARTHEADPGPGASGRQVVAVGRAAASACCGARAARACALPA